MGAFATVDEIIERERACGILYGPYWRAKYLERAPERVRRDLLLAATDPHRAIRKSLDTPFADNGFPPTSFSPVTAGTETDCWTPAVWSDIVAGDAAPGSVYHLSFGGIYGNRTTSSPASTWTPRWGQDASTTGVALGASGAVYAGAANSAQPLFGEFVFAIYSIGTTGTGTGNGFVCAGTGASGAGIVRWILGGTVATIDTTTAQGLKIAHTWSTTNASNTLTVQWVNLKGWN